MIRMQFGYGASVTLAAVSPKLGYLPGGTAMVMRGRTTGRITKLISDKLGRYTGMALRGKDESDILIITVYRVCQRKGAKAGPTTAFMQQYVGLRERGITNTDPRNQGIDDLTVLIDEWATKGYHPIVMGDLNAVSTEPELQEFMTTNRLHDLIAESNEGTPPATYSRSANRLDYILGTHHVQRAATKSGALGWFSPSYSLFCSFYTFLVPHSNGQHRRWRESLQECGITHRPVFGRLG